MFLKLSMSMFDIMRLCVATLLWAEAWIRMGSCGCVENSSLCLSSLAPQRARRGAIATQKRSEATKRPETHTHVSETVQGGSSAHMISCVFASGASDSKGCAGFQRSQLRVAQGRRCRPRTPGDLFCRFDTRASYHESLRDCCFGVCGGL